MEEWMELRDDGHDDSDVADDGHAKNDSRLDFDHDFRMEIYHFDSCKERLRSLFDQVLLTFLGDKSARNCIRPIPALCSEGKPIDLYKLFWLVRKMGGYNTISKNNLWGFVSEECGSSSRVIASVKLVYMKYLKELDQWLQQVFSKRVLEDGYGGFVQKLDKLSWELEITCRGLLLDDQTHKDAKDRAGVTLGISENELHLSPNTETRVLVENNVYLFTGEGEKLRGGDGLSWISSGSVDEKIIYEVGNLDGSVNDDFAENVVNVVNGFSKGQTDADHERSYNEGSRDSLASAKKIIDKVVNKVLCGESINVAADGDDERFPIQGNNDACISAKKVVKKAINKILDHSEKFTDHEQRFSGQQSPDNMISSSDIGNLLGSRKRKRQFQSYSGMLNWLIHVAKHSNDPSVGLIPGCSKWGDYGNEDFWVQALSVRESLLIKKHVNKGAGEVLWKDQQKKPRMHPSMYEDDVLDHRTKEKLRFSKRVPITKSHLCPCCISSAESQSKQHIIHQEAAMVSQKAPVKLVVTDIEELPSNKNDHELPDVPRKKDVSVGPLFQAEVPKWTGVSLLSDSKWLGTRMWPLEDGEENSVLELDPIGKGRNHLCNCPFPDSVECVRFHVAEKRLKLKKELGILFYNWRFNRMGEEVSLSWTEEEEITFNENMRSYATFINKSWSNACRFIPSKTREKLVSYYFNVYLVRRRSYQNRVTPKDVDSDADEKNCGSISGSVGCKELFVPGSSSILCTLNKESNELV